MRTQSSDTSPEAEQMLISLIRKAPITKRFELVNSWTKSFVQLSQHNILESYPDANEQELAFLFLSQDYGEAIAELAKKKLTDIHTLPVPDLLTTLDSIAEVFEYMKIPYYIGGSIASSTHGMRQAAKDIDIVANIHHAHMLSFIAMIQADYYADEKAIGKAVQEHTFFSIIHLDTLFKVDVFVPELDDFNQQIFKRTKRHLLEKDKHIFYLESPEDIILMKLKQYKHTEKNTDDQWNDILGVFKVQGPSLDFAYLDKWASLFKVKDLLENASIDAGLDGEKNEAKCR